MKTGGPYKAQAKAPGDAWWYSNKNSIDVVIQDPNTGVTHQCRIFRHALAKILKAKP